MLTKGIVEKLIDSYRIKVRIPVYNKPSYVNGATITNDLYEACICTLPNCSINLQVGDIVILGFEDNDIAQPIILGCLYAKDINDSKTDLVVSSIEALNSVNLPQDTHIGNVTPTDLGYLTKLKSGVQEQLDAVGGIADDKVDKVSTPYRIYGTDVNGEQWTIPQNTGVLKYSLVLRDINGCAKVATPVSGNDAATKAYVDKRADYVIEQGTSGNWTYRKWNSGILEQWGGFSTSVGEWKSWGNVYESSNHIKETYAVTFVGVPILNATLSTTNFGGWLEVDGEVTETTTPEYFVNRPLNDVDSSAWWAVSIYAIGKWKN